MIGDVRAVEEEQIVGAVSDARERLVGIIRVELDLAFGPKQRRADRAAKVEIEAGRRAVRRLADQPRTRHAAAADDAGGLDAIDDRTGVGEGTKSKREHERDCGGQRSHGRQRAAQLYAGSVAGRELNPSGMMFWIPCRTSSGVTPIAAHPLPP